MTNVFINYSFQDRPLANEITNALEQAGLRTWQDSQEIKAGEEFVSVIRAALEKSECIVTLWTPHSVVSSWVLAEAKIAREMGTQLPVAVRIDVRDIPPEFMDVQALTTRSKACR
jgi:hypothetical protein